MVAFKTVVFTILVPGMVGGLIPWLLAHSAQGSTPVSPVWMAVGLLPLALGVGLYHLISAEEDPFRHSTVPMRSSQSSCMR